MILAMSDPMKSSEGSNIPMEKRSTPDSGTTRKPSEFDRLQDGLSQSWKSKRFPMGVHRFKSHDEADEWWKNVLG